MDSKNARSLRCRSEIAVGRIACIANSPFQILRLVIELFPGFISEIPVNSYEVVNTIKYLR